MKDDERSQENPVKPLTEKEIQEAHSFINTELRRLEQELHKFGCCSRQFEELDDDDKLPIGSAA